MRFRSQRSHLQKHPPLLFAYTSKGHNFRESKIDNIIIIPFFIIYIPQYLNVTSAVYDHLLLVCPRYWNYSIYNTCGYRTDERENFFDTSSWYSKLQCDKREFLSYFTHERTTKSLNGNQPTCSLIEKPCRRFCGLAAILQRTIKKQVMSLYVSVINTT